jgi:hypothetical protein
MKPLAAVIIAIIGLWWATPTYDSMYVPWKMGVELGAIIFFFALFFGGMVAIELKFWRK